ncbi:MAG TPA: hypothetical protein VII63_04685 [Caulobacteraceae bacterium]
MAARGAWVGPAASLAVALVTGSFGGDHVALDLGPGGGRVEFDCGAGTIDEPVRVAADGRFSVGGHIPAVAGGVSRAQEGGGQVVRYVGTAIADTVIFTVATANGSPSPTYRVRRGQRPRLLRCR